MGSGAAQSGMELKLEMHSVLIMNLHSHSDSEFERGGVLKKQTLLDPPQARGGIVAEIACGIHTPDGYVAPYPEKE